jgi:hypothetical protein
MKLIGNLWISRKVISTKEKKKIIIPERVGSPTTNP